MSDKPDLDAKAESREASALKGELDKGDSTALKEHINRLYSEHGLKELKEVLGKLKGDEEKGGVQVAIKDNRTGLPDITIAGTDTRTDHKHDFKFKAARDAAHVTKDSQGRLTDFKTPDGKEYKVEYEGTSSEPKKVTIPESDGTTTTLEKIGGAWAIKGVGLTDIRSITIDADDPSITLDSTSNGKTASFADGRLTETNKDGNLTKIVETSGRASELTYDGSGNLSGQRITDKGSPMTRLLDAEGKPAGYEFKDGGRHIESLKANPDGSWTLSRGESEQTLPRGTRVEIKEDGGRKLVSPDGASFEGRPDGSVKARDSHGRLSETVTADGGATAFHRDAAGRPTEIVVRDSAGDVRQTLRKGDDGWQPHVNDGKGGEAAVKDVKIDEKTGTYTLVFDGGRTLSRRADGVEDLRDAHGKEIPTRSDELVKRLKDNNLPLNESEEKALRADLASIDMLPKGQRDKVYASLERVAGAGLEAATRLSPEQQGKMVTSLADQIAHPERALQGGKNSCVMANAEQTLAKLHPDRYANMVEKLAVDGQYVTAQGKVIEAQRGADGRLAGVSDNEHKRSMASELAQNAFANMAMPEGQTYKSFTPGDRASRDFMGKLPDGATAASDTGERVFVKSFLGFETMKDFGGFNSGDQVTMLNAVSTDGFKAVEISSRADLERAFADNGGPPLNVGVSLKGNEGNFVGMGAGDAGTGPGSHAVNITHIGEGSDGQTYVYYDNPAGGADRSYPRGKGVPIGDFVKAMTAGHQKAVVRTKCGT